MTTTTNTYRHQLELAGFAVTEESTGGGMYALAVTQPDGLYALVTDEYGEALPDDPNLAVLGIYGKDHELLYTDGTQLRTLVNDVQRALDIARLPQ
jgi:hypothetical protein